MKTYLFDFDGTLVDSMPTFTNMFYKLLNDNGVTYPSDIIKRITPLGYAGSVKYLLENTDIKLSAEEISKFLADYSLDAYTYKIPAKDGVVETLKELKRQGDSLNVLTASPHITLDPCLKRLGIYDLFDNVWSCEDFSTTKSNPEIYVLAAQKIGKHACEVIFIDDNVNADIAAKKSGMTVYGIYDDSSKDFVEEMKAVTDRYIYNFKELL